MSKAETLYEAIDSIDDKYLVTVKGDEAKRYITIGSRNGWQDCDVLNEGY